MANPNVHGTGANAQDPNQDKLEELKFSSLSQPEAEDDTPSDIRFRSILDEESAVRPASEEIVELSDDDLVEVVEDEDVQFLDDADLVEVEEDERKETADTWFHAKGIDNVKFSRTDGSTTNGILIKWMDPDTKELLDMFEVVGRDQKTGKFVHKTVKPESVYKLNPGLSVEVAKRLTSTDTRANLTSLFDEYVIKPVQGKEINNGANAETLEGGMRTFELDGGKIDGVAATSKAGYKYEKGKDGQPKDHNEDVWLVDVNTGLVGVFDGMGGGKNGMRAVETTATIIADNQNDIPAAAKKAQEALKADPDIEKKDGACFLTVKPVVGQPLEINQCGDVDLYHFGAAGEVKYQPGQHIEMGKAAQSAFEAFDQMIKLGLAEKQVRHFVGGMVGTAKPERNEAEEAALATIIDRILTKQKPVVERDNPLFGSFRRMVVQALTQKNSAVINVQTPSSVEAGDWILVMSDGVSDNFLPGEIEDIIKMAIKDGRSPEWATKLISRKLDDRIKLKAKNDPIAKKNLYKLDNATIVVMRVKPSEKAAVVAA